MNEKWSALPLEEIEKKLRTNAATGLSKKAAGSRIDRKEPPFFTVKKKRWDKLLLDLFRDFFLVMLVLVAFFALFFEGDYIIGSAILIITVISLGITFWIHYRSRRTLESMSDFFAPTARVIRGGKLYICDYRDVVVGDVILVEKGDILGCDARLVHSSDLSVRMKTDKKSYKLIQKYANGAQKENELYAENMSNMLHAGSVVESGSGRAIVVAIGKYTYLGAMTGGITEIPSQELPKGLSILKKHSAKIGIYMLLLILPFCIFSILFGHFTGGTVVLSEVLTVVLSIGAMSCLSAPAGIFESFFVHFIRKAALSENPCIVRSIETFDRIADMDYLFMLDGSITTDGILHFDSLVTADGESKGFDQMGRSASMLCDMLVLYDIARRNALSTGSERDEKYDRGISELIEKSGIDVEALKIRAIITSFLPAANEGRDTLICVDRGERQEINVSYSDAVLDKCTAALFSGNQKTLTQEGVNSLKRTYEGLAAMGRKLLTVTLKNGEEHCFVGMLVLREGVDLSVEKAVNSLKRSGVKVILFANCIGRSGIAEIPDVLRVGNRAYAGEFIKKGWSVTQGFGEYDEYCYFDEGMIAELAKHVKSKGKSLAVIGFSNYAKEAIECSDIFISCAPVRTGVFGRFDEEIRALEIPGEQSSSSCTQEVKAEADVLLMRPSQNRGGLEPLARVMEYCKVSYRNLKNFLIYLICVQTMRLITVAFPMLFGNSTADARQLLFLGFILDLLTMFVFLGDTRRSTQSYKKIQREFEHPDLKNIIKENLPLTVSMLLGSIMTLLLPNVLSLSHLFGRYAYKAEFTFISLSLMQLLTLLVVYSGDLRRTELHVRLSRSPWVIAQGITLVLFTLLCLVTPMGNMFGIVRNPIGYFLVSFVPAIAFGVCHFVMTVPKKHASKKNM